MVLPAVRQVVRDLDPTLPFSDTATMEEMVARSLEQPRSLSMLVAGFAIVALVLSTIGIYGVMAYYVQQHTKDISIRLALGGSPGDVLRLVVGQGMQVVATGVAVGVVVAFVGTRLMSTVLFGVGATDAVTLPPPLRSCWRWRCSRASFRPNAPPGCSRRRCCAVNELEPASRDQLPVRSSRLTCQARVCSRLRSVKPRRAASSVIADARWTNERNGLPENRRARFSTPTTPRQKSLGYDRATYRVLWRIASVSSGADRRIAAHHAIQRDDVDGGQAIGGGQEVGMDDVHRAGTVPPARFTSRRGSVGRRRVHDCGLRDSAVQQLEREGPDPAADIQQVTARGAGGDDAVAHEARRRLQGPSAGSASGPGPPASRRTAGRSDVRSSRSSRTSSQEHHRQARPHADAEVERHPWRFLAPHLPPRGRLPADVAVAQAGRERQAHVSGPHPGEQVTRA